MEQAHIASAIVFDLSMVSLAHVQKRVVGQIRNIGDDLVKRIASGIGIALPKAVDPAKPMLNKAGVIEDAGVTPLGKAFLTAAAKRFFDREPNVRSLA